MRSTVLQSCCYQGKYDEALGLYQSVDNEEEGKGGGAAGWAPFCGFEG